METWGGRRSAAYASLCGPLLPFSRRASRSASYPVPSDRPHESGRCQAIPTHRLCAPPVLTHDHPADIAREKMPYGESAVGRVQGSGPPHYSGIRFGIRFRVPIRSHPINIAESPNTGGRLRAGVDRSKRFCRILQKRFTRVRSGRLPIRSHPINPIRSSPAGGCPGAARVGPCFPRERPCREMHPSAFRGGNIEGRPAGGGPGFFRDGRHVSG